MAQAGCGSGSGSGASSGADVCSVNMGLIHLKAGDLVSAYRFFLPMAEAGDAEAIGHLVDICERAGDSQRAASWAQRMPS